MVLATVTDTAAFHHVMDVFKKYESLGPVVATILPLLESFLPVLPLFVFIFANVTAFGFWAGYFYSWFGTCSGTMLVFVLIRKFGQTRFFHFLNRHPKIKSKINWIN